MTPQQRAAALRMAKWHQAMADEPNRNGAKKEKQAVDSDRERCAHLAEAHGMPALAAAIRARTD